MRFGDLLTYLSLKFSKCCYVKTCQQIAFSRNSIHVPSNLRAYCTIRRTSILFLFFLSRWYLKRKVRLGFGFLISFSNFAFTWFSWSLSSLCRPAFPLLLFLLLLSHPFLFCFPHHYSLVSLHLLFWLLFCRLLFFAPRSSLSRRPSPRISDTFLHLFNRVCPSVHTS